MSNDKFFDKQTDSSRIKANIVAKYFPQYCRIIDTRGNQKKLIYLDLFAGPGIYKDGGFSTPMLIGQAIAKDQKLRKKVLLMFNDNNSKYIKQLEKNFEQYFPDETFELQPRFGNRTVGDDKAISDFLVRQHPDKNPHPTLLFFDPWGYKGINTNDLAQFMQNWGNEIFLFVNIIRIHAAIENGKFDHLMELLFPNTIEEIKQERRYKAKVHERLALIMDKLEDEFKLNLSDLYCTAFKFQDEESTATSHYIVHFTKHHKGYELVKQIFYDFDNIGADLQKDGTYTFDAKRMNYSASLDFDFTEDNLAALREDLIKEYAGRTLSARELFDEHHVNTKYCGSHYSHTLRQMHENQDITAHFTDEIKHRKSVTLSEFCILKFK